MAGTVNLNRRTVFGVTYLVICDSLLGFLYAFSISRRDNTRSMSCLRPSSVDMASDRFSTAPKFASGPSYRTSD